MTRRVIYGLLLLFIASCAREAQDAAGEWGDVKLTAGISALETKTWLDSEGGGSPLKVYWSDGDRILVNGQISSGVNVVAGEKVSAAEFSFRSISAPFKAFYPAEAVNGASEDGTLLISVPDVQAYSPTTFANGSAMLYGYAGDGDKLALKNLCAAVKVNLKDALSSAISSVSLYSPGVPVAGTFTLNPESGEFTPSEGTNTITLDLGNGITLGPEGTDFWFVIPAGYYQDGLQLSFVRADDHRAMLCNWTPAGSVVAGRLYCFEDVNFAAAAKDIETAEEWEEFALAYNEGGDMSKYLYKDGSVRLGADISAKNFTSLKDWTLSFDGQDYSITRTAAESPLFGTISGSVSRLTLKGDMTRDGSESYNAALAPSLVAGGSISGVVNQMDITLTSGDATVACLAGIVGTMSGGTLANCRNEGSLTANIDCAAGSRNVQLAGIVGQIRDLDSDVIISGCSNSGTLTINPSGQNASKFIRFGSIAGIVAWMRDSSHALTVTGCNNSGSLVWTDAGVTAAGGGSSNAPAVCAGGIIGNAAPMVYGTVSAYQNEGQLAAVTPENGFSVTLSGCVSSGDISCKAISGIQYKVGYGKVFIAGLAGALVGKADSYVSIDNCSFTGTITAWNDTDPDRAINASCKSVVTAGLVGWGGYLSFTGGTSVKAAIGDARRQSVAIAGGIGFAVTPFSFKDCRIWFEGVFSRTANFKNNRAIVAVVPVKNNTADMDPVGIVEGSSVVDCQVGGDLYISQDVFADTVYGDLTDGQYTSRYVHLFNGAEKIASNLVCGQGYTSNSGVTVNNVTYWAGK